MLLKNNLNKKKSSAIAFLLIAALFTVVPQGAAASLPFSGKDFINKINEERGKKNLSPLKINSQLGKATQLFAKDMLAKQYFGFKSPDNEIADSFFKKAQYGGKYTVFIGNNDSKGRYKNVQQAVKEWIRDGSKEIFSKNYSETGVDVREGRIGGIDTIIIVQALGSEDKTSIDPKAKVAAVVSSSICDRKEPYPLAPELQGGFTVLRNGLLSSPYWQNALPLKRFQNCLHITFANKASEYAIVEGALGVFLPSKSSPSDLRIIINPVFAKDGHVLLGETMGHEITHAWQFLKKKMKEQKRKEFLTHVPLDCYGQEAEAFWTETAYINWLAEADENDLRDALREAVRFDPKAKRGAWNPITLIDFTSSNWSDLIRDPVNYLRTEYVMKQSSYVQECSS